MIDSRTDHRNGEQWDDGQQTDQREAGSSPGDGGREDSARAQIIELLGTGIDDYEEDVPDLEHVRQASVEANGHAPANGETKTHDTPWYDQARRKLTSLLNSAGARDDQMVADDVDEPTAEDVTVETVPEGTVEAEDVAPDDVVEDTGPMFDADVCGDDASGDDASSVDLADGRASEEDGETVPPDHMAMTSAEPEPNEPVNEDAAGSENDLDFTAPSEPNEARRRDTTRSGLDRDVLNELRDLIRDDVVLAALEEGAVALPRVVEAVQRLRHEPRRTLWRHLADVEGVDRDYLFGKAADLGGYEKVDIAEDRPSTTFLHTVLGVYPPPARKLLIEFSLLPFAFEPDVEARRQGFLIATHDPGHPDVAEAVADLDPVVRLFYAPEDVVARRVDEMREMERRIDEDAGSSDEAPRDETDAHDDDAPVDVASEDAVDVDSGTEAVGDADAASVDADGLESADADLADVTVYDDAADAVSDEAPRPASEREPDAGSSETETYIQELAGLAAQFDQNADLEVDVEAVEQLAAQHGAEAETVSNEPAHRPESGMDGLHEEEAPLEDHDGGATPDEPVSYSDDADLGVHDEHYDPLVGIDAPGAEPEIESDAVAESATDVETDAQLETDAGGDALADVDLGTETDSEVQPDVDAELNIDVEPDAEAEPYEGEHQIDAEQDIEAEQDAVGEIYADAELEVDDADSEASPDVSADEVATLDENDETAPEEASPENPVPGTDEALAGEDAEQAVRDDAMRDGREVADEVDADGKPDAISGDGYGDLNVPPSQQGENIDEAAGDQPGEPPLPPDIDWGDSDAPATAREAALATKDRVAAMLLHKEIVTPDQVTQAERRRQQSKSKETLWRVLATVEDVDSEAVYREAAVMYAFPLIEEGAGMPDSEFARNVMNTFGEEERDRLIELRVMPFELDVEEQSGAVRLAFITHDPTRPEVHKLMKRLHLERFELMYAPETVVSQALAEAFPRKNEYLERINDRDGAMDFGAVYQEEDELIDDEKLEAEISRSTLINLFEASLIEAVRRGASDLHIYPNANKQVEIHFRVDGRLAHWHTEEKVHPEAMLAVIKDNSTNVDRFERDAAQDGFIQRWIDEALIRFRVSVLPIANASQELRSESIVIRVLDDRKVITDLSKLGLLKGALQRFDQAIHQPHGMVILTGPTGSGKSTTLVASLHQVVTPEVNVLTVEDPVEYIIPGVRQIKLNHKLDLGGALRAILRHDPDVVMVGEMRDRKTAELAIKLANTGHLTFSTLHTNDAPSAVSRLYKMGIEPFLIAYAINLVVAQRLIRTLCPDCKKEDPDPDAVMLQQLGFSDEEIEQTTFYQPAKDDSCPTCRGQGYKGRRAVSEALYFSRPIRHMIVEADGMIDEQAIRAQAEKEGMLSLQASAREVVKMGETSAREMMRVVATGD